MFTRNYNPARVVEVLIEEAIGDDADRHVCSEPWNNGREHGFRFSSQSRGRDIGPSVYVAECRHSDDLTVTASEFPDWVRITGREYERRERFGRDEFQAAAQRVLELLGLGKG